MRVRVRQTCEPIHEKVFKDIIHGNYYTHGHFYFELNHVQTNALIELFTKNVKTSLVNSYPKLKQNSDSVENENEWTKPKKTVRSVNGKAESRKFQDDWTKPKQTVGSSMPTKQNGMSEYEDEWIKANNSVTMDAWHNAAPFKPNLAQTSHVEGSSIVPVLGNVMNTLSEQWDTDGGNMTDDRVNNDFEVEKGEQESSEPLAYPVSTEQSLDWRLNTLCSSENSKTENDSKKLEREQVLEKLKYLQKVRAHASVEVKAEAPPLQNRVVSETSTPKSNGLVLSEWEKMAREKCLQEQSMLRKERDQLQQILKNLDVPIAKAISMNLELCASAIAQVYGILS